MSESTNNSYSVLKIIFLSLFPGIIILFFYTLISRFTYELSIPPMLILYVVIPIALVPFQLGYLLYKGYETNNRISLKNLIQYKNKIPLWQFFVLVIIILAWSVFVLSFFPPIIDDILIQKYFYWIPEWFFIQDFSQNVSQYSSTILFLTWIIGLVFNGIIAPIVEELYFRGYLLPRQENTKAWAPLINTLLFSLYHFFTPWQNITRVIALLPLIYIVWWKRNIYIGIVAHCALNTIGIIGILPLIISQ